MIEVNYAALEQCADDVNKAQQQMTGSLEQVEQDVKRLCSTWTGQAQEAYLVQQKKYDEAQAELIKILASIETAIMDTKTRYMEGDKGIANSFGG
ncbi:WXG100 family type VII secretion target [Haloechinothrix salitolerans]|uniref:ESAT-6-like protein n=1 Tax=Haloechinothrix salitolerans TaxID=926830 RepID=A0ABW2C9U0_9PSEU